MATLSRLSAAARRQRGWNGLIPRPRCSEGFACGLNPSFSSLDGTLVDSVYQHVLAWKEALDSEGINLSVWRIHRKIGMSGGLFTNQLLRETRLEISAERRVAGGK